MKTNLNTIVATLSLITSLPAFPPGPRPQQGETKPPITPGDLAPLEALADKFGAFQKSTLHGESYYAKTYSELQKKHSATYTLISESLASDRINEKQGAWFISELFRLGKTHQSKLKDAATLTPAEKESGAKSLTDLQAKIKEASLEQVAAEILTPEINKVQQTMHELCLFTQSDSKLNSKTSSLTRRLEDMITDEQKIKEDGTVSDRERKKIMADLTDTWAQYIVIIKR